MSSHIINSAGEINNSSTEKSIKIMYFAALREQAGQSEENYSTRADTPEELYHELSKKYEFSIGIKHLRVSVNNSFSDFKQKLKSGDELVFIPPVAGG